MSDIYIGGHSGSGGREIFCDWSDNNNFRINKEKRKGNQKPLPLNQPVGEFIGENTQPKVKLIQKTNV